jgi:hypothetical protein
MGCTCRSARSNRQLLPIFAGFTPLKWLAKVSPLIEWIPDRVIAAVCWVEAGEEPSTAGCDDRTKSEMMDRQRSDIGYLVLMAGRWCEWSPFKICAIE